MPCSTEPCGVGTTYDIHESALCPKDSRWTNYVPIDKRNIMNRTFKSLVLETVFQLCSRNDDLEKSGVSYKQLHTVLSLRLSRGTSPALITALIEKEIHCKTVIRNPLGNYTMNPDLSDFKSLLVPEESSSDSNPEVKEAELTTQSTEVTNDTMSQADVKPDKDKGNSDKVDVEDVEKSVRRQRRKRRRNACVVDVSPERSPSPSQQNKSTERSVLFTNSNGRRIIRKITKYDPSEFYLTPLIRKKKEVLPEPKEKPKRGRPPLKAKLSAAVSSTAQASTTSEPPKKVEQANRETKSSQKSDEPNHPLDLPEQVEAKPPLKSSASMLKNECYLCSKLADVNDEKESLACSLCLNIAHNKCVTDDGFYKELKKWRCSECLASDPVVCSLCEKEYKKSDGAMVMCDFCEEMFHVNCHDPPVKLPISTFSWRCSLCPQISLTDALLGGREDLKSNVGTFGYSVGQGKPLISVCGGPACLPTQAATQSFEPEPKESQSNTHYPLPEGFTIKEEPSVEPEEEVEDNVPPPSYKFHRLGEPIPRVDNWTSKQVADYFSERFGPIVGNAFLSQDIDGRSLKLMRRNDVTEQLGLHFGIALKVLYYVKKIQLNTNVMHDLWS